MKVLVLGWEYPPAVAGGLGAACHGLTHGLAELGHDVILAVPDADAAVRELAEAQDHPRIQRVWLGRPEGCGEEPAGGAGEAHPPLTPYAVDGPVRPSPDTTESSRVDAARRLYGADLAAAVAAYTEAAVRALARTEVDVIHAHDWMTIPAATRLRLAMRRPVCLHVHSTAFDRTGSSAGSGPHSIAAVERAGVRTADRVIAVSGYTKSVLVREYGADPERISVVHNAAPDPPPTAAPGPGAAPAGAPAHVLFLARLTRQKGAGFFLRAAARVHAARPDVRFIVAGDGEERAALIEQSASLGIAHRTFFPGSIDDGTRDRLYRDAAVFVLSSISEPFGLTPLEALRHGTPAIVTEASGVREVLPSAPTAAPWDAAALATSILDVVGDPSLRQRLVEAGQRELEPLTWRRSAAALVGAFQRLLPTGAVTPEPRERRA